MGLQMRHREVLRENWIEVEKILACFYFETPIIELFYVYNI